MPPNENNGPNLLSQIGDLKQLVSDLKAELSVSDDKFRRLTDSAPVGIYLNDAEGRAIYINNKCAELVGVPADKALNFDWIPFLHPDDRDRMVSEWEDAVKNSTQFHSEYRWVHQDGKIVWTLGEVTPIIGDKGKASQFIGTLTDITERKKAEEKSSKNEARLKAMVENIHDVIVIVGEDGNSRYVSPNIKRWFGWSSADILKTEPWQRIHSDDVFRIKDLFVKIVAGEQLQDTAEYRYQCKDGSYKWVECMANNCLKDSFINGILITFRDISRRKKLQKEHERSTQLAALGTVAAGVAHEINNPIQGILNYASLIEKNASSERIQKASSIIVQESQRIAGITKNLLTYSKDSRLEMSHSKVEQIINDALSLITTKIKNSGISLSVYISQDLPEVYWQFQSIQQVILNLVENATHALSMKDNIEEEKRIKLKAELTEKQGQQFISIIVQDNGIGMSQETIDRAFEPFFTTKPSDMGTGLGLSIVNDIISKHNGTLTIESEEQKFTKVEIEIPVAVDQEASEPEA